MIMKNIFKIIFTGLGLLILTFGCKDENENVRPGLYTEKELIETFPGDTVLVSGTASNYIGLSSVSLSCESWGIKYVYDLSKSSPTVFNYSYKLVVPDEATFDQVLEISATDKNGVDTRKAILLSFLPDMNAPIWNTKIPSQVEVNFGAEEVGIGYLDLELTVSDDRQLKDARLEIPGISYDETFELSGRNGNIETRIEFQSIGTYPATLTLSDVSNNISVIETEIVAILEEEEKPFSDYPQMYVIDAKENPEDYINGYYRYMDRRGEYQYDGKFYASTDDSEIYFVPEKRMDGDLFGVSPQVSSKLMNNNGYVKPIIISKKGYYYIWIDLKAHTYEISPLDIPENACTDDLYLSGTGFSFGDWGSSPTVMTRNEYRYEIQAEQVEYTGGRQYYFYTSGWARVFRADSEGNWWFEASGGDCATYQSDYVGKVLVTFDSAHPWATIKKK